MISSINDHILNSVQKGVGVGKQNGRNLSSTKNYKKKDYVSRTSGPRDPRTRKFRHMNTPERLTRGINIMHTPADWTVQTIESVFAGSGSIVKVDESRDPRTNKLIKYTVVYMDQQECSNAMRLLSRITPTPPFMYEMALVPDNKYPLTPRVLDLNRNSFPYDKNINLPQEMLKRVPLETAKSPSPQQQQQQQQYSQGQQQKSQSSSSSNLPMVPPPVIVPIPDVLTKASSMLPPYVASRFCIHNAGIEKRVDENLGKVPIPQLIEIVSSLKNLVQSQQGINHNLLEQQLLQFLSGNQDVAVAVAQLLYEYDLFDVDNIDALIKESLDSRSQQVEKQQQQQQFPPQQFPPQQFPQQQFPPQQFPQQQFPPQQMPQQQFSPQQMPQQQQQQQHILQQRMVKPTFTHRDKLNLKRKEIEHKLSKLTEQEATVIRQILEITPSQVVGLPAEQKQMIENIHKEYLDS